jgi:hypothetical protein
MTIDNQFNELKELKDFLDSRKEKGGTLNIVGRSLFRRHCGEGMLKLRSYRFETLKNGRLNMHRGVNSYYCIKCGYNYNTSSDDFP